MRTRTRTLVAPGFRVGTLSEPGAASDAVPRLSPLAIGTVALYALAALVVIPEGNPSPTSRLFIGIVVASGTLASVGVLRWGSAWARGASMLILGSAMTAVAGGVIARRLADGVSPADVLGGIAGVAGITLVITGWRDALRGIRRAWTRVAIVSIATLVVAQFVLLPAIAALDVTNRPRPTGSGRTPADVGLPFEDVRIRSADGTALSAWWVPSRNGAAIVLLPGSGSTRHAVLDHAALIARHGFGALLLDWRGHGRSAGRSMEFGWGADRDVSAAVSFVLDRPSVTAGVGVLGLSMGGEVALTTAADDPRIRATVVEGVSARTWADARREPDPHPVGYANQWLTFALVGILAPEQAPPPLADLVTRIEGPVLMIAGAPTNEQKLDPTTRTLRPVPSSCGRSRTRRTHRPSEDTPPRMNSASSRSSTQRS